MEQQNKYVDITYESIFNIYTVIQNTRRDKTYIDKSPYSEPVKAIILWILLIFFSYLATVIIYRIPRFGKYILYMR